jgi:hypothetical protein
MGLLDKLTNNGSTLSVGNGATPSINPLATAASRLHDSYSINGSNASLVNSQYASYNDGAINILPQPSQLDLDGATPTQYLDNLPG